MFKKQYEQVNRENVFIGLLLKLSRYDFGKISFSIKFIELLRHIDTDTYVYFENVLFSNIYNNIYLVYIKGVKFGVYYAQ